MSEKKNTLGKNYCFHLFRQANITWDGQVMACCEDVHCRYPLGDLKKQSFKEIWNGNAIKRLRKLNFQGKRNLINICRSCSYPQPTRWQGAGVLILDHLFFKKVWPSLERHLH